VSNIIPIVVFQHAQDAADLHALRTRLLNSPSSRLENLQRFDDRLAAHIDGLAVAGTAAIPICDAALSPLSPASLFTATVHAINIQAVELLRRLVLLAESDPKAAKGLVSAFGWTEQPKLRGIVAGFLRSSRPFERLLGFKICAMHRVLPPNLRETILEDENPAVRARALQLAGELGYKDMLPVCVRMLDDPDVVLRFWAAWAATLLGNRQIALEHLGQRDELPKSLQSRALLTLLLASTPQNAHSLLQQLAGKAEHLRSVIRGSGLAGNPFYVTWLIGHMSEPQTARLAGEAFSLITGLEIAALQWVRKPEGVESGPTDDPDAAEVELPEDEGLPWPDYERIAAWWQQHQGRFTPGTRYFLGAPVNLEQCRKVLAEGTQRQRMLSAHHCCILEPGTALFEWRAPAARQRRQLAAMA
jgi:uncharacterized protein (TIGR02270 family)